MEVVCRRIVIHHVQWLVCPHRQDMRPLHPTFLFDDCGLGGSIKRSVAQPFRNEDDYVLQIALRVRYHFLCKKKARDAVWHSSCLRPG